VVSGIIVGSTCLNYFVFGNPVNLSLPGSRLGDWHGAQVRPACYGALASPKKDSANPQLPYGQHRIAWQDHDRMVDMTAALHCYVVTQRNAVCNADNRAYVVDYIKKYFVKMDAMLETANRYGDGEVRNVRNLWNSPNNRAIMAALDNHFRYGRLNKSDFGWSAPAALKPLLDKYAGAPDNCVQERPWTAVKL
jgi:hypothetical protein